MLKYRHVVSNPGPQLISGSVFPDGCPEPVWEVVRLTWARSRHSVHLVAGRLLLRPDHGQSGSGLTTQTHAVGRRPEYFPALVTLVFRSCRFCWTAELSLRKTVNVRQEV